MLRLEAFSFNLLHRRHMSILISAFTALVCVYDLVDVALPEDVLILSSLKVFGSVDEQDVIRIAVALPLEYEDTDRNTGCRRRGLPVRPMTASSTIQLLDEVLADHLFGSATAREHHEGEEQQLVRLHPIVIDHVCKAQSKSRLASSEQACHTR